MNNSQHTFLYGGPRNGSWYYQYVLCARNEDLYSGTENIDYADTTTRMGVGGTVFKSVVNDSLYDSLTFAEYTKPGNLFEVAMIQPRDTFLENLQLIEDAGRFLVCKGKESFDLSGVPHEKIYIRRPLLDQWKSYATARLLKKFQWEDGDVAQTDDVSVGDVDTAQVKLDFRLRMNHVYNGYEIHKDDPNFTVIDYADVMSLNVSSPLVTTPPHSYDDEVTEYIEDTSFMSEVLEREASIF